MVAVVASGCTSSRPATEPTAPRSPAIRASTGRQARTSPHATARTAVVGLPAVVHGVPVAKLAGRALRESTAWSDPHPTDVRAVATTWGKLDPRTQGPPDPVYVVALTGRLACIPPTCSTSHGALAPPRAHGLLRKSYMLFTVAVTGAPSPGSELRVDRRDHDLSKLGRVLELSSYLRAHR